MKIDIRRIPVRRVDRTWRGVDHRRMNTFMAIMSQLFWGVTVGALTVTASAIGKILLAVGVIGGFGWWALRRRLRDR
jgi:hypothetical protein